MHDAKTKRCMESIAKEACDLWCTYPLHGWAQFVGTSRIVAQLFELWTRWCAAHALRCGDAPPLVMDAEPGADAAVVVDAAGPASVHLVLGLGVPAAAALLHSLAQCRLCQGPSWLHYDVTADRRAVTKSLSPVPSYSSRAQQAADAQARGYPAL